MLENYFQNCMYFSSNLLNRAITRMAEEAFHPTGLSPTYAFLMMSVQEQSGITQKELGKALHVTPSTVTRFIEKLAHKGLVSTRSEGKMSRVELTPLGSERMAVIRDAWKDLARRYSEILGTEEGRRMSCMLFEVGRKLEDHL